jgi:hypothetical protein
VRNLWPNLGETQVQIRFNVAKESVSGVRNKMCSKHPHSRAITYPGLMLLTRIPVAAISWASWRANDFTKPLLPPYAVSMWPGHDPEAEAEATITTLPRPRSDS